MPSMRRIKERIRSVRSTGQITKAMKLVSASKLQKAKARLEDTRPFYNELKKIIADITATTKGMPHVYLKARPVKKSLVLVITSNRGLCGGYNANACKAAVKVIKDETGLIVVGSRGREFFLRRKNNIVRFLSGIETPNYEDAAKIGRMIAEQFRRGEVDEVYLTYTEFASTLTHVPTVTKLLPLNPDDFEAAEHKNRLMLYEPDEETVLNSVVPWYLGARIYTAMVESTACEHAARMTSMDSATDNALDIIDTLTIQFNRARQGAITQEITEIVSGANANS